MSEETVLLIQNKGDFNSCEEIAQALNITCIEQFPEINTDTSFMLGCVVSKNNSQYYMDIVFATVLQSVDDEHFDLNEELELLRASADAYIDPIEIYQKINSDNYLESINNTFITTCSLEIYQYSGWGYLYGKNGDSTWGYESGYTLFGDVRVDVNVERKLTSTGYKYDLVTAKYTATGCNDKYVESYKTFQQSVNTTDCIVNNYSYINESAYSYSFTTSWNLNSGN